MRPGRPTAAHQTDRLAELVCSNSLKSESESTAPWLLKEELRRLWSLLLRVAQAARVPGGHALTVDLDPFAAGVTAAIGAEPLIELRRDEVTAIPGDGIVIIASGPLTSGPLAEEIARITGRNQLFFYDSISHIVDAETVDTGIAFWASRYGKSTDGTDDYLNCPFNREQYDRFVEELLKAQAVSAHIPEDDTRYFEACLPIEEIARRGRDTLRFGPMKPVGLSDPRAERRPYAVVQLRQDNALGTLWNMVGFQTKLKHAEQVRIFRTIPGLANAHFARLGGLHRNTFINSPRLLDSRLRLKSQPHLRFAGQVTGVEGYVESAAIGLLAGRFAAAEMLGIAVQPPPPTTAFGALLSHITGGADARTFQPMNVNFGLFPELPKSAKIRGKDRKQAMSARALQDLGAWLGEKAAAE